MFALVCATTRGDLWFPARTSVARLARGPRSLPWRMDGRPNTASAGTRRSKEFSTFTVENDMNDGNSTRRRRKRPSTAASSSTTTLSTQKKMVAENVRDIEEQLGELQRVGAYDKAGKLYAQLTQLKSSFKNNESLKWIERHKRSLKRLPTNERAVRRAIEASWLEKAEEHKAQMDELCREMEERHQAEVVVFKEALLKEQRSKPPKFSTGLLQLQEMEQTLSKTHKYDAAVKLRKEIQRQMKYELRKIDQSALERADIKLQRLKVQHQREYDILRNKAEMKLDRMVAERDKELEHSSVRFRAAQHELEHALSLQIASKKKGASGIADAALGASRRGEITAAAAATYASRGRLGNKQFKGSRGRPTTAPVGVGRRGKKLMPLGRSSTRRRPGTALGMERTGSRGEFDGTRKQRRRRKKKKKKVRLTANGRVVTCDWCSQVDGYIESHGGVQIPAEGSSGGVGKFCCWECAKSWNQQYTPVMQRWVRSMFIDDVAGYMVTYSKRKHVEKNLSQRG